MVAHQCGAKQYGIDKNFSKTRNTKEGCKWNQIRQGNADIDDVPHKHYLKEELQLLLNDAGFTAEDFQKIEYNWDTEFIRPPKWLKEPKPWDWMVVWRKSLVISQGVNRLYPALTQPFTIAPSQPSTLWKD